MQESAGEGVRAIREMEAADPSSLSTGAHPELDESPLVQCGNCTNDGCSSPTVTTPSANSRSPRTSASTLIASEPSQAATQALTAEPDAFRNKEQHVALPLSLALRLVQDKTFLPGPRPPKLDGASRNACIFKEVQRIKRRSGSCDAWVNSGGARGGRNLVNTSGEVVLRRRYGKVLAAADGGRGGKLTGNERRYQEYTTLQRRPDGELVENRDVRLYELSPFSVP